MRLKVNGDTIEISDSSTVLELLNKIGVEHARVAVEVNLSIVRKPDYEKTVLSDGDTIEIVNFVGGGQEDCFGSTERGR